MKWFIRLFLLLGFFLLSESSLFADSHRYDSLYSGIKYSSNLTYDNLKTAHQLSYSSPVLNKKEYRKIKGTKEEDDDKKSVRQKRTKGLENTSKYLSKTAVLSTSPQAIAKFYFVSQKETHASRYFLCANRYKLYNLFQVFRI